MLINGLYLPDPVRPRRRPVRFALAVLAWGLLLAAAGGGAFLGAAEVVAFLDGSPGPLDGP
jgi:hypothetical protein